MIRIIAEPNVRSRIATYLAADPLADLPQATVIQLEHGSRNGDLPGISKILEHPGDQPIIAITRRSTEEVHKHADWKAVMNTMGYIVFLISFSEVDAELIQDFAEILFGE